MANDFYGTVDNVESISGVSPRDLGLEDEQDPDAALQDLITRWLKQISSQIDARLPQGHVDKQEDSREALNGLAERKATDLISFARHSRSSPIIQIDEFATKMINSSQVYEGLDEELEPFKDFEDGSDGSGDGATVEIFSSVTEDY